MYLVNSKITKWHDCYHHSYLFKTLRYSCLHAVYKNCEVYNQIQSFGYELLFATWFTVTFSSFNNLPCWRVNSLLYCETTISECCYQPLFQGVHAIGKKMPVCIKITISNRICEKSRILKKKTTDIVCGSCPTSVYTFSSKSASTTIATYWKRVNLFKLDLRFM